MQQIKGAMMSSQHLFKNVYRTLTLEHAATLLCYSASPLWPLHLTKEWGASQAWFRSMQSEPFGWQSSCYKWVGLLQHIVLSIIFPHHHCRGAQRCKSSKLKGPRGEGAGLGHELLCSSASCCRHSVHLEQVTSSSCASVLSL